MSLIYAIDLAGTFVFAVSGMATATEKKFDLFGASIIALVTAVGGGTIRDLLIGSQPVGWLLDVNYHIVIALAIVLSFFFLKQIMRLRRTLFLFDAIGIGLFTVLGLTKTLEMGLPATIAVIMGAISASFGGVIRDILCNEIPLIFGEEIYATACLAGGILYLLLTEIGLGYEWNLILTIIFVVVIRILAVKRKWSLPKVKEK